MNKLSIFMLVGLSLFTHTIKGQSIDPGKENASQLQQFVIHVDVGTNIIVSSASLNGEFFLKRNTKGNLHWYLRGGFAGAGVFYGPVGFGGIAGVTMLTGKGSHHFETSAGIFVGNDTGAGYRDGAFVLPVLDLGYRFQKPNMPFVFRAKAGLSGVGIGLGLAF